MMQEPDPTPGNYYVSVVDGPRTCILLGPFREHVLALAKVDACRARAVAVNDWAWFYSYGTCKMPEDYTKPGLFNGELYD